MSKLSIDASLCQGHGRCYTLAPEWFDCDDEGYGVVLTEEVTEADEANVRPAVEACPERAIELS